MNKTKIIAEIGLNFAHGKDKSNFVNNAKKLIDIASFAGFDFVKFQKRNPNVCVPDDQKKKKKEVPWRNKPTSYLQYKKDIELDYDSYIELYLYARKKEIGLFASVWDKDSVDFMRQFHTLMPDGSRKIMMKIPSALITNIDLIKYAKKSSDIILISTGMSDEEMINKAVTAGQPKVLFHTNSAYPSPIEDLNLRYIKRLQEHYPNQEIGYSGHEYGLTTTFGAMLLGAKWIERHITLDRTEWGSDQMASVEPVGQIKLIKGIRELEIALGSGGPRTIMPSELLKLKSLRGK